MARILVIDDERDIRTVVSRSVERLGHECHTAIDATDGRAHLHRHEYDVVITDIRMGPENGLDLLEEFRDEFEHCVPCIVITAFQEFKFARQATGLGVVNFLTKPFSVGEVQEAVKRALELREAWEIKREYSVRLERELQETIEGVLVGLTTMLEGKSRTTADLISRVRDLCTIIAMEMGYPASEMFSLRKGAMLHDIGKSRVETKILEKPGPLTPDEWETMRRHPEFGVEIVSQISFLQDAVDVIHCHHERFDGKGYPRGLRGDQIPLSARIFSVVDAFDAILSKRSYKEAQSPSYALNELRRNSGTQFDPDVVEAFERVFDRLVHSHEIWEDQEELNAAIAESTRVSLAASLREEVERQVRARMGDSVAELPQLRNVI